MRSTARAWRKAAGRVGETAADEIAHDRDAGGDDRRPTPPQAADEACIVTEEDLDALVAFLASE
jgi:hypothetical protein